MCRYRWSIHHLYEQTRGWDKTNTKRECKEKTNCNGLAWEWWKFSSCLLPSTLVHQLFSGWNFDINLPSEYSDDKALVVIKIFISAGGRNGESEKEKKRKCCTFTMRTINSRFSAAEKVERNWSLQTFRIDNVKEVLPRWISKFRLCRTW